MSFSVRRLGFSPSHARLHPPSQLKERSLREGCSTSSPQARSNPWSHVIQPQGSLWVWKLGCGEAWIAISQQPNLQSHGEPHGPDNVALHARSGWCVEFLHSQIWSLRAWLMHVRIWCAGSGCHGGLCQETSLMHWPCIGSSPWTSPVPLTLLTRMKG